MRYKSLSRVLALDLHQRRFGYVVLESPDRLLDWGVRSYRHGGNSTGVLVRKRLRPLLKHWRPSILILHNRPKLAQRISPAKDRLLKRIVTEATRHRVTVRILTKKPGADPGKRATKYENARLVAERFPALRWNLPEKRKPWESEDYRMSMFAAAAAAMTFFSPEGRPPAMRGRN